MHIYGIQYNVISCIEVAKITETLKIADFTSSISMWQMALPIEFAEKA